MSKRDWRAIKALLVALILLFMVHFSIPMTASRVRDSVVMVHVWSSGFPRGQASGVVIDDGIILTARHVVNDADEIYITTDDGVKLTSTEFYEADNTDLGLIIFDCNDMPLQARLSFFKPFVGQTVFGIGSRFGLNNSFFQGFVGSAKRFIPFFGGKGMVQLDAMANPGDSGCAVFNRFGNVVGIVVGGRPQGVTFIIPAKIARLFLAQYRADEAMRKAE